MSELTQNVNAAIKAADSAQVAELVINATEKERRELRKEITDSWWHQLDKSKREARLLARCGSATARQIASEWWTFSFSPDTSPDLTYRVLAARGPEFFETFARNIIEQGVQRSALFVRRALEGGAHRVAARSRRVHPRTRHGGRRGLGKPRVVVRRRLR